MKLKLRGNANALTRSAHRAAATTEPQPDPTPEPDPTEILATLKSAKTLVNQAEPPTKPDRQADLAWAAAMTDVAAEYQAELPSLPPAERRLHLARIAALSKTATTLTKGEAPSLKARLLNTTALPNTPPRSSQPPSITRLHPAKKR